MQRNITGGVLYITISLFILCSLIFYDANIPAPFIASTNADINATLFKIILAFCSNITIQFFGLFSYLLVVISVARGTSFFYWERAKFKYQRLWFFLLLILIPTMYNVMSTYPVFKNVLSSSKFDCYAGGNVGYFFSKLIFIDLLKQTQVYKWQIILIFITVLWALQYVCCFSYARIFKSLKEINNKKTNLFKFYTYIKKMSVYLKTLFIELQKLFNSKYTNRKRLKNFEQKRKKLLTVYNMKKSNNIHNETTEDTQHEILNTTNVQTNDANYECDSYNKQPFDENIDYSQHEEYLTRNVSYNDISIKQKQHKYLLPSIDLLDKCDIKQNYDKPELFKELSGELLKAMDEFGIKGEILKVKPGPIITVFEFKPAPGIKTSRIISLSEDIARSMSAISARISTIPGRNVLGIEIPNKERHTVHLYQLFSCDEFKSKINGIQLALGQDTNGNPVFADLTRMPHLLIAGTTGSGKSVSINDMILSILFKFKPNECKLIMIDPKMLELSVYDNIPHLLIPVVTEPKKAVSALKWAVTEMEQRYRNMAKLGVRNIDGFNKKLKDAIKNPDLLTKKVQIGFDSQTGRPTFEVQKLDFEPMPYIVIFVDEMADLMLVAGKEVETAIQRLAQMARAAGIHLIMATQRPSVDVITGTIKANFPTRISFQVSSKIDSRTILGEQGAEQLLGQGDMLYMSGVGRLLRVHAPFVQDTEIDRVVDFVKSQELPHYVDIQESETNNKLETEQLTIEQPVKRRRSQSH